MTAALSSRDGSLRRAWHATTQTSTRAYERTHSARVIERPKGSDRSPHRSLHVLNVRPPVAPGGARLGFLPIAVNATLSHAACMTQIGSFGGPTEPPAHHPRPTAHVVAIRGARLDKPQPVVVED